MSPVMVTEARTSQKPQKRGTRGKETQRVLRVPAHTAMAQGIFAPFARKTRTRRHFTLRQPITEVAGHFGNPCDLLASMRRQETRAKCGGGVLICGPGYWFKGHAIETFWKIGGRVVGEVDATVQQAGSGGCDSLPAKEV